MYSCNYSLCICYYETLAARSKAVHLLHRECVCTPMQGIPDNHHYIHIQEQTLVSITSSKHVTKACYMYHVAGA